MKGAIGRMIQSLGKEYTVLNADGDTGDRQTPNYTEDGTIFGVLESRSRPATEATSSGEEVSADMQIRTLNADDITLVEQGEFDYPTKFEHPDGYTYELIADQPEDSDVTVLIVVRD